MYSTALQSCSIRLMKKAMCVKNIEWQGLNTQVTADAGEDVEKEEHSSIAGGIAGLYNHSGNQSGGSSENWT